MTVASDGVDGGPQPVSRGSLVYRFGELARIADTVDACQTRPFLVAAPRLFRKVFAERVAGDLLRDIAGDPDCMRCFGSDANENAGFGYLDSFEDQLVGSWQ